MWPLPSAPVSVTQFVLSLIPILCSMIPLFAFLTLSILSHKLWVCPMNNFTTSLFFSVSSPHSKINVLTILTVQILFDPFLS